MYLAGFRNRAERAPRVGIFVLHVRARLAADHRTPPSRAQRSVASTVVTLIDAPPLHWRVASMVGRCSAAAPRFPSRDSSRPPVARPRLRPHRHRRACKLEALFEAVPLAIAVFDGELRLVNANARYHELTGVPTPRPVEGLDLRRVSERARRPHRSDRRGAARLDAGDRRARPVPASRRPAAHRDDVRPAHRGVGRPRNSLRRQRRQRARGAA